MKTFHSINTIGVAIKALREKKGINIVEMSQLSGVTISSLYRIETLTDFSPGFNLICKIADALGVSIDVLRLESEKLRRVD